MRWDLFHCLAFDSQEYWHLTGVTGNETKLISRDAIHRISIAGEGRRQTGVPVKHYPFWQDLQGQKLNKIYTMENITPSTT
jgi:MOSC domain-containing protein YiiM